jgi:hypothetical protein
MLEEGHHPALRLDRGEPSQASDLHQLKRGKVRRPGPGPHRPGFVPQLPGSFGLARVTGLDRGAEQLAVLGGQAGGASRIRSAVWPRADNCRTVARSASATTAARP